MTEEFAEAIDPGDLEEVQERTAWRMHYVFTAVEYDEKEFDERLNDLINFAASVGFIFESGSAQKLEPNQIIQGSDLHKALVIELPD
jgi:hypothetical protein